MSKRRVKLSEQIRRAVDAAGVSRYRICKATGLEPAAMSRFMAGKVGLSLALIDAMADFLDLTVVAGGRKPVFKLAKRGRPRKAR